MALSLMVQGTMSGAGKSLLVTALCRIFYQDGFRVAPFKSQNMALNSYITPDGLEIGRAQAAQAEAAGRQPNARMNPILLKPCGDSTSQVIVNGRVRGNYPAAEYFRMTPSLIPEVQAAYNSLAAENDIIVIEGAGSPAEINLPGDHFVNMSLADLVNAPVLLVGNIEPGGVFAQLYGTIALLKPEWQRRIIGTVINNFRGDIELLRPGFAMLEELTHKPLLGVIPHTTADIDDEDSMSPRLAQKGHDKQLDIAIIRLPHISNFTDFAPLEEHPAIGLRYVGAREELGEPDCLILPGTKSTLADLRWLRQCGLAPLIQRLAARHTPIIGVCGGYQMLGEKITDAAGVELEGGGSLDGLSLLPVRTDFQATKARTRVCAETLAGELAGARLDCYEIHMGQTTGNAPAFARLDNGRTDGAANGLVWGTYLHGLFDSGELVGKLADLLLRRKGLDGSAIQIEPREHYRQRQYDLLADVVRQNLAMDKIYQLMQTF